MNFDSYWKQLITRVYKSNEILLGKEEIFFRISHIYGETMVDGIETYFERRFDQFDDDMEALRIVGFADIAAEFQLARLVMFGDLPLTQELVQANDRRLLNVSDDVRPILDQIDKIYARLIPRLEILAEYKYALGLSERFYTE